MQELLKKLNDKHFEAVLNTEGPCLVIAGAGSGKTKVLTHPSNYIYKQSCKRNERKNREFNR